MYKPYLLPDLTPLAETKPRTFTPDLDGLIAWLRTQDGATMYDFWSSNDCLLARFLDATKNRQPGKCMGETVFSGYAERIYARTCNHQGFVSGKRSSYREALSRALSLREGAGT